MKDFPYTNVSLLLLILKVSLAFNKIVFFFFFFFGGGVGEQSKLKVFESLSQYDWDNVSVFVHWNNMQILNPKTLKQSASNWESDYLKNKIKEII